MKTIQYLSVEIDNGGLERKEHEWEWRGGDDVSNIYPEI